MSRIVESDRRQGHAAPELARREQCVLAFGEQVKGEPSMLESLAKGLGGAMVKVEVHGNLNEPKITTTKLPVFQKPFELFGEKKKK